MKPVCKRLPRWPERILTLSWTSVLAKPSQSTFTQEPGVRLSDGFYKIRDVRRLHRWLTRWLAAYEARMKG